MENCRQLQFDILFSRALVELPAKIDLHLLLWHNGDENKNPDRYSVEGLYDLIEEISLKFINAPDEVLMRNLYDALFTILRNTAKYSLMIDTNQLRLDPIQREFERRLQRAIVSPALGWGDESIELVHSYFAANSNSADA